MDNVASILFHTCLCNWWWWCCCPWRLPLVTVIPLSALALALAAPSGGHLHRESATASFNPRISESLDWLNQGHRYSGVLSIMSINYSCINCSSSSNLIAARGGQGRGPLLGRRASNGTGSSRRMMTRVAASVGPLSALHSLSNVCCSC